MLRQLVLFILFPVFAHAASDMPNLIMVGEGISSPTDTFVMVGENPAGLIYTKIPHVSAWVYNEEDVLADFEKKTHYGLMGGVGSGKVAAGLALLMDQKEYRIGLSFAHEGSGLAVGIQGVHFTDPLDGYEYDDFNVGFLFGYKKDTRYGITVYDVYDLHSNGINKIGAGMSVDFDATTILAVDSLIFLDKRDNNKAYGYLTPGVRLVFNRFHISLSSRVYVGSENLRALLTDYNNTAIGFGYYFDNGASLQYMSNYLGQQLIAFNWLFGNQ